MRVSLTRFGVEFMDWNGIFESWKTIIRTNKHKALSLQEVELDRWFLILHSILKAWTIQFMHKFIMSFVFHFYILDWCLEFELVLQPKSQNLRALQNETHMGASILNTARYSAANTKCEPNIICNSSWSFWGFIVLQLLSLTKWFFIQISIIDDNISSQVADKRR